MVTVENIVTVKNNMNVKQRYRLTRRLATANNLIIRNGITNFCLPPWGLAPSVGEHDGPYRKLPLYIVVTLQHLVALICHTMLADSETDIARLNRGMSIRHSKKRTNLINEARIKACISRLDSGAFLRAVSHSVGAHAVPEDGTADSDAEDDDEVRNDSDSDQPQSAVSDRSRRTLCEVCLVQLLDLLLCRAGTGVSVLPASLSLNNKLEGCPMPH